MKSLGFALANPDGTSFVSKWTFDHMETGYIDLRKAAVSIVDMELNDIKEEFWETEADAVIALHDLKSREHDSKAFSKFLETAVVKEIVWGLRGIVA